MAAHYLLEREYRQIEAQPSHRLRLRIVGRLLEAAIGGPPRNQSIEHLLEQLDGADNLRPLVIRPGDASLTAEHVARYRSIAQQCRGQAAITTSRPTADVLLTMAADNDRSADELEARLTMPQSAAICVGRYSAA